ncbi:uncharacterized protein LOC6050116 isoform X2 [Culex quinquefasciatus]|nr:uncharacterized protein LOC6050116 isoform X2 [Culex quinquefasciatus]
MYKLREERLKELYNAVEVPVTPTRAELIMEQQNTTSGKFGLTGKGGTVTGGHGDSLPDQSFESFKTKEIRDSESPTRFGTVIPSDNSGWHIKTSEEVSADGKTHTQRSSATTEGTKEVDGGRTSFAGKNEEARSERFEGDEKNFVHSKGDQSATFLAENTVIDGDDGRKIEKKSTSISSSSSSKVIRSQQVIGDDTDFARPEQLGSTSATTSSVQETKSSHTTRTSSSTQQQEQSLETDGNIASKPLSKDPERVAKAFRLIALPGTIITEDITVINPSTKMITTVKRLEDGTEVTTRTYEKIGEQPSMALENLTKELRSNTELMREYEEIQKAETRASKKDVADKITNLQFITEERSDTARSEQIKKQQQHEVITTSTTKITSDLDATHDSFARSLRCVSPSESVRSVRSNSGRSSVSPDKSIRGRRSPSRESDTSRFSTHTTTRTSRTDVSTTHKDYMRPTITSERKVSNLTEAYDTVDKTKLKERSERLERSVSPKKVPQNTPDATPSRGPSPDKLSSRPVSKTPKESSPFCSVNSSRAASPIKRDSSPSKITSAKLVRENSSESFNVDTTITVSTKDKTQQQTREDVEVFHTESQLTDLDDITINVKLENVTDDIEVTTTVEEVDVGDQKPSTAKKSPKEKPPLVRSETFEERCRKILGMPGQVEPEADKPEKPETTTSIFSTYDNTLTRSSEIREKRKKIEQEIKTIESETLRAARKTSETSPTRRQSSPAKQSSPVRKHSQSPVRKYSQPSPERRPKDDSPVKKPSESKEASPVRKQSQPSPDRRPKEQTPVKKPTESKESSPVRKQSQSSPDRRPVEKTQAKKPAESPIRKPSQPSPDRRQAKKPEESPVRKRSQPSPDRAPAQKEPSPHRCSRSHERSPIPVEKPKTPSPTKTSTDRTDATTIIRTTRTSKADILVNQKTEGKNMSVTEITIQPVIEVKKADKILTKQTSDSKFERKTTNSRAVTNKSSSDFDVKRKAAYEKTETMVDRSARGKPRTPATSPDKRRTQDTSPTKTTEKSKHHITVAKIKIEPVRKTVQSKFVVEDKSKTAAKTTKTTRKFANETEPESDKDTGISDNEMDDETVTTVTTTTITTTKKHANNQVTDRKDSAPVYRTTGKVEKSYTRSSSDNVLKTANTNNAKKTTTTKTTAATATTTSAKKSVDRPVKCVTTKTINLSAKPMIDSDNLDNVVIDIQQAKSSREPTPNKLIPIPVSPDEDTGKPRYPDTVQEPDDEPKHVPKVSNIPILEETSNEYIGCEITEVEDHEVRAARASRITNLDRVTEDDESLLSVNQKVSKFVEEANRLKDLPTTKTPNRFVRHEYEELDEHLKSDECLLSVSDKVTKFISTAEEVKKIRTSGPFVPECKVTVEVAESDECLLSVNDKVSKFASKTTEEDEEERGIDEKKKKFISSAVAPQKSPELVKNVMKQTTRSELQTQEEAEAEQKTSIVDRYTTATLTKPRDKVPQGVGLRSTEAVKKAKQIFETGNKPAAAELARQKDILSRPSIWEDRRKKEQTTVEKTQSKTVQESNQKDVKLMDIGVYKKAQPKQEPEPKVEEPKPDTTKRRDSGTPKTPAYIRDTVSTKKDMFEKRISSSKIDTSELVKSTTSQEESTELTTSTTKRPSITEKYERTISRETPTPGGKPSYMNHTVSSLEHMNMSSRRESVDNTLLQQQEFVETTAVKTSKFGVELKRTDSGRNVLTGSPTKRKSSVDSPVIEDIFDLEALEKMLESVNGYEQRRRIRSQIRLVKKAGEKVTTTTTTTTTMRTNSRVRDASPKRKEPSPTRAALRKGSQDTEVRTVKTVEVEAKKSEPVQRSVSPTKSKPMTNGKTVTSTTTVTAKTSRFGEKVPAKEVKDDGKPIWATGNILKKASETTRTFKTSSTTSTATKKATPVMREVPKETKPTDCITSSYGVGPTDENGLPLFGIRALKKKAAPASDVETKITGSIVTETLYSENGSAPVGERKTTVYSSDAKDLEELNISGSKRNLAEVREKLLERENSRKGLISLTKTEKIGNGSSHVTTEIGTLEDVPQREPKIVRKGSVKELTERFVHKESSSSLLSEKTYPKAGLILRSSTQSHSSRSSTPCEISSIRSGSIDFDENDVELRSGAKSSSTAVRESVVTSTSSYATNQEEVEDGGVFFRKSSRQQQTRSFLNDGSRVSGVQDVLERMRNADNVEESGDSAEDREARALLNKFLGASVLMSGMESLLPGGAAKGEDTEPTSGTKKVSKVTTTRTVKSTASSSSNAPKPSIENLEQIWDEASLKQLLDSSTNYEERRRIRARLRQIMAEKEACADIVASVTADLQRERQQQQQPQNDANANASIQGESLLLPLLQGILLHKKKPVAPVEDSGTESGEDLRLLAAGLHDNMELYRGIGVGAAAAANAAGPGGSSVARGQQDGVDGILHDVTAALLRLQLSLRDGKDMNLDSGKRNALLTLACRLQLGLMQPERLPEQVSPVEEIVDGVEDKVDYSQARRGSARFAKRRNRNNRHTVGVSREELADARRFIEEIGRMETMSSHSPSATPEKSKTPEKSQLPYSLQKQQSLGTVLSSAPAPAPTASTFAMKRPSQFIPNGQEANAKPADRKAKQKLFRQSQSFDAPTNGHEPAAASQHKPIDVKPNDPFKKPVQTAAQRALVKKYSFNDGSTSEEEEPHKTAEQVVLQKNAPKAVVNTVHKMVSREVVKQEPPANRRLANARSRTPDAQEAHVNGEVSKPLNKYTSKKLRMKRANTIDIPKKPLDNGVDSEDDSEGEQKQSKERPREVKAKTPVASIVKPVVEVPDFKPKTENDKKFMAFLQKQNQTPKAMWSSNPVKEHVGGNNWSNKFDHLKHNFEKAEQSNRMVAPSKSAPKCSAMNFWKKAESASFDESVRREFAKPPKPVQKPTQPKLPPKNVASVQQPPQIPDKSKPAPPPVVVPKPKTPTASQSNPTQFTHAPTSAFKPIPKKLPPVNLDFKPVHPEPEIVKPIPAHVSCGIVKQIVEAGFKETPDVKPEPIPVQLGLVKSLAAAGYHETPYVPLPKIERTPTHHVLNYQAMPAEPLDQPAPAAPWIGKKPADTSGGNRVASIASTKFTANQFGMNKGSLPTQQPLTYQGSLKYAEKPLSFQLPERIQAKRPSLPDVGDFKAQSRPDITYTFTDYTQPESVSTFTLNRSDSLTNPDNQPLVLTSTNSVYSPQQYSAPAPPPPQQINYLTVADAMSSDSPSNVEDDDLESIDSQEMRVVTRVMKAPVSQQASYSSNKPSHLGGGGGSAERGSAIAQNLHSSLKLIKQKSPTPPKRMMPNQKRFSQDYGEVYQPQFNVPRVEIVPNTPQAAKPQPPQFAIYNNVQRFPAYEPPRPAPLARTDSWVRLNQQPAAAPISLARAKSSHTLALPAPYNGGYEPQYQAVNDKQRTMEAYFAGQKPTFNALAKTASTHNILRDKSGMTQNAVRPVSYAMGNSYNPAQFNIMNSQQQDYRQQQPMYQQRVQQPVQQTQQQQYYQPPLGGGLSRSRTMPHIPMNNLSLLDEDNVEDAFEQLMNQSFAV